MRTSLKRLKMDFEERQRFRKDFLAYCIANKPQELSAEDYQDKMIDAWLAGEKLLADVAHQRDKPNAKLINHNEACPEEMK